MGILNSIPTAKDRTDCDTMVSISEPTESIQNTDLMADNYGLPFNGKTVKYNMIPVVFLFPHKMYAYNEKCGEIITYGYGSSRFEAIDDAANKFLEKLASISEIDDHLRTNPPCLKINEEKNYTASIEGEYNNKERLYTVKCSAGPYESKGVGKTKKIAKQQAAQLLIEQNNSNQHTSSSNVEYVTHEMFEIVDNCG
ncbi:interferon-inducible double-stranded RNA-dependent protein kinase activator A [Aphis craccivora]|uniref:Interferon-inducible double-stranded RNA-dependent protein kinase activator A n=1 Tax=Aphis craccivora TaxID=307492 RepID=A0A6G0Y3I8_APHCR|nr:interferon-inducible double-stranded RNA-dependent protein kinase activator A [Aphis craccivora]